MKKRLLILSVFLLALNLTAQNTKKDDKGYSASNNVGIMEVTVYKLPLINYHSKGHVNSKIRRVVDDSTHYFFDLNEGKTHCSIPYEDLQSLVDGIVRLKNKLELEPKEEDNGIKKMIIHPNGFRIGFITEGGKSKSFFSFGGVNSILEKDLGEVSIFNENYDTLFYEKYKYGTFTARLKDLTIFEDAFTFAKTTIETIMRKEKENEMYFEK